LYTQNTTTTTTGITIERDEKTQTAKLIPIGTSVTYNWCQKTVYPCRDSTYGTPLALPPNAKEAVSVKTKQWFNCKKGNTGTYNELLARNK